MSESADSGPAQTLADFLARMPYAGFLGVRPEIRGDELTLVLPFQPAFIGNMSLPALHGGVIGAFLELAALAQLSVSTLRPSPAKTIDINIDYLRSGRPVDTYARARIVKRGRRLANVMAEAWQGERQDAIAALRGHFLLLTDEPPLDN